MKPTTLILLLAVVLSACAPAISPTPTATLCTARGYPNHPWMDMLQWGVVNR